MQYQITSDNIDLSQSMIDLAKAKAQKVEARIMQLDENTKSMRIVMNSAPQQKFTVRVELTVRGKNYFTDETSFTLENALIQCMEELDRILEKEQDRSKNWNQRRESKRAKEEDLEA